MNYFGIRPYIQIYESYLGLGDKVKAESYLMDLIKIFPDNKTISQLMDLNILNKAQVPESNNSIAQNILNKAHESETNNPAVKNEPIPELSITVSKYYALIIGESQYSDPLINELEKPIKDAEMVYNTLTTKYTFDKDNVKFLKNATMAQIVYAFDYFAKVVHPVDNFLVFTPVVVFGMRPLRLAYGYLQMRKKAPNLHGSETAPFVITSGKLTQNTLYLFQMPVLVVLSSKLVVHLLMPLLQ